MGCCRKDKKKTKKKNESTKKVKTVKAENKKNANREKDKKVAEDPIPTKVIDQSHLLKTENVVQEQPSAKSSAPIASPVEYATEPSPWDDDLSPNGNIVAIKTLQELQTLVQQHGKPISIVLFYARYCPYSKRTAPGLRQWARSNNERIDLYEVDVEQASKLAEYYHVRTVPTIMAFEAGNLLAPIWQRTANNVLETTSEPEPMETTTAENSTEHQQPIEEIFRGKLDNSNNVFIILDPSMRGSNRVLKMVETPNETKQEQYLLLLDTNQSVADQSKLILAVTNEKHPEEFLKNIDPSQSTRSVASSQPSSYIWNASIASKEAESEQSQSLMEYRGRMVSQTALSTGLPADPSKRKRSWNEPPDDNISSNSVTPHQQIHLVKSSEIFYEKQYYNPSESHLSSSVDRLSTLTYEHIRDVNSHLRNQEEEICILYFGPNRCRGFEDHLSVENNPSKLSLLTLKSQPILE